MKEERLSRERIKKQQPIINLLRERLYCFYETRTDDTKMEFWKIKDMMKEMKNSMRSFKM